MPWQEHVADVVLELDPATGLFVYDEVGLTVPRQSGKSTLILAVATHRGSATGFFGRRQKMVYTAQTRNKAREKWEEDYVADLKGSKTFGPKITPHFGNGNEHVRFANGSRFGIEANTEKAGHGGTLDLAFIDEAFAQQDGRLEQAFSPAMITRRNKQLWWVSTAGWKGEAGFLEPKVRRGRDLVEMGVREGLAYFEWSAPEDADPEDRAAWWECMPALGHTITEDAIAGELRKMEENIADFRRAYLNQWVPKGGDATDTVVDMDAWTQMVGAERSRPTPVAFAVDVSDDRKWTTIGLAGVRSDGRTHVQVVETARGTAWLPDRLEALQREWKPAATVLNPAGPAGTLLPKLKEKRLKVRELGGREVAQAAAMFLDGVTGGGIVHADQPVLSVALGAAKKRKRGEVWVWDSKDGTTDVAPLRAVSFAMYGLSIGAKRSGKVW